MQNDSPAARLQAIAAFYRTTVRGKEARIACPAHGGSPGSLSLWLNDDASRPGIGAKCWSGGCSYAEVAEAIERDTAVALNPSPRKERSYARVEAREWEYKNPQTGEVALAKRLNVPAGGCTFADCKRQDAHKHVWTDRQEERRGTPMGGFLLRRYDPVGKAPDGLENIVVIPEGEATAEAVAAVGVEAMSYIGGAERAKLADYTPVANRTVILAPDNDQAGTIAALEAGVAALRQGAAGVLLIPIADFAPHKGDDLADLTPEERIKAIFAGLAAPMNGNPDRLDWELAQAEYRRDAGRATAKAGADGAPRLLLRKPTPSEPGFDVRNDLEIPFRRRWKRYMGKIPERRWDIFTAPGRQALYRETVGSRDVSRRKGATDEEMERLSSRYMPEEMNSHTWRSWAQRICVWHQGWRKVKAIDDPALGNDYAAAAARLRAVTPGEYGRIAYVEARTVKGKEVDAHYAVFEPRIVEPPAGLSDYILKDPGIPLPPLGTSYRVPVINREGDALLLEDGYHRSAAATLHLAHTYERMDNPAAVAALDKVFAEFPFKDRRSDRAGLYAFMLTSVIRNGVDIAPMASFDKPAVGTGATLMATCAARIAGLEAPFLMAEDKDREKFKRSLSSVMHGNAGVGLFDNIHGLYSDTLATLLTSDSFQFNPFYSNTATEELPVRAWTFAATGNNPQYSADILSRTYSIRLDAGIEKPETREGFAIELPGYVVDNAPMLNSALVSLVDNWLRAGSPPATGLPAVRERFGEWKRMIGGILQHAGIDGFLANVKEHEGRAQSGRDEEVPQFVQAWWDAYGGNPHLARDLVGIAYGDDLKGGLLSPQRGAVTANALGKQLGKMADRIIRLDDATVQVRINRESTKGALYWLEEIPDEQICPGCGDPWYPAGGETVCGLCAAGIGGA